MTATVKNVRVTWIGGTDRIIPVYEWNGCGQVPAAMSDYSVICGSRNLNRIRQDLAIIRRMVGKVGSVDSYEFRITFDPSRKEFRLWVRNWSCSDTGRASYYAGMVYAYRKIRHSVRGKQADQR
jgi:hypothetical protein